MLDLPLTLFGLFVGVVAAGGGLWLISSSGARLGMGRRLAGARQHRVGELLDLGPDQLPARPIRVAGRIRCPDPIVTARDDRLVALHRDVEVRLPDGRWQPIERLRETRGFELWDHDGSLTVDPAEAAEPLVTLPHVWRGSADELLEAGHRAAIERLLAQGRAPDAARSVTRMISVVDRLLVLAVLQNDSSGGARLLPPRGGYVISNLDLPDAMRLLGGARRRRLLAGAALLAVGGVLALVALAAQLLA